MCPEKGKSQDLASQTGTDWKPVSPELRTITNMNARLDLPHRTVERSVETSPSAAHSFTVTISDEAPRSRRACAVAYSGFMAIDIRKRRHHRTGERSGLVPLYEKEARDRQREAGKQYHRGKRKVSQKVDEPSANEDKAAAKAAKTNGNQESEQGDIRREKTCRRHRRTRFLNRCDGGLQCVLCWKPLDQGQSEAVEMAE